MAKTFSVAVQIGGSIGGSFNTAINTAERRLKALSRSYAVQAVAAKSAITGIMDAHKGLAKMAAVGGLAFSVKTALGDGAELAHELQGLRNAGRTAHEVADGLKEAVSAIRDMPTANLTNSIKILNETTGAFGDYHHAVENLKFSSKLGDVLKNTTGVAEPAQALGSLIKGLEIRGSASNPAIFRREAEKLAQAMVFFRGGKDGGFTPDKFYTFASNAQVGIRQLNERFLTRIAPSMIQEMGGDKVGTGLTAFRTIISGRKITDKKQADAWQKLGLLNSKDVIKNKMGDVTGWRDGAIAGTKLAYQDPLEFIEKVVLPRLQAKGTDITDPIELGAALNTLFKNTKANAFVTGLSTSIDRTRLKKDEGLINKVLSLDKIYDESLSNDPKFAHTALESSLRDLGASLTLTLQAPYAQTLVAIARGIHSVSASLIEHPGAARALAAIATALSAAAALRLANLVFGITGMARALAYLSLAATTGLAARLIAVSRGLTAITVATSAAAVGRLRATAAGLLALNAVGGSRLVLATMGASIAALGAAVLRFPIVALRTIGVAMWGLVANPVGATITAIVVALAALGVWVSNNWQGVKTFFASFGQSFADALGPEATKSVGGLVDGVRSVWDWLNKLLGPIDETGAKWAAWGEAAGSGAAAVVNAVSELPSKVAAAAQATGKAIVNGIVSGIKATGSAISGAVTGALGWAAGKIGLGGDKPDASKLPGRALGGPVSKGMPYLVGERGPELFVPSAHGAIKTNAATQALVGDGRGGLRVNVDASPLVEAGKTAVRSGETIHASLDTVAKPIVDTSSIDEALIKVGKLDALISAVNGSSINVGAAGGLGGGPWDGKTLAIGNGSGIGHTASQAERAAFIKSYASSIGMDANTALRVAQSEGFNKYTGDQGRSFGDFQLFTGGGVGNRALRAGINVRDPNQWKAADKFALDVAKREGWGQWHGARRVGIGNWQGIGRRAWRPRRSRRPVPRRRTRPRNLHAWRQWADFDERCSFCARARGMEGTGDSIAPSPAEIAKYRSKGDTIHHHGPVSMSNDFRITESTNPRGVERAVEAKLDEYMRRLESEQRGLLSD